MARKRKQKNNKRNKKVLLSIFCIILVLCIGLFAVGFNYYQSLKEAPPPVEDTLTYDFDDETQPAALEDDPEFDKIFEGNATEFKAALKEWATNGGDVMYSQDVLNVLCIGVDTRNKNTISGLSDSMIIVSVNKISLLFFNVNSWKIFLLGIPGQLAIFLAFRLKKYPKEEQNG